MHVEEEPNTAVVEAVMKAVAQHAGTLKWLEGETFAWWVCAEGEERDALDRLEAMCREQGIVYEYDRSIS